MVLARCRTAEEAEQFGYVPTRGSEFTVQHLNFRTSHLVAAIGPKCSLVSLARLRSAVAAQDRRRQPRQQHVCPSERRESRSCFMGYESHDVALRGRFNNSNLGLELIDFNVRS